MTNRPPWGGSAEMRRENEVRTSTGTFVTARALPAARRAVTGCGGDAGGRGRGRAGGRLRRRPVACRGPGLFTDSTVIPAATPSPAGRTPQAPPPDAPGLPDGRPGPDGRGSGGVPGSPADVSGG
ncbi:hypothetical protein GCM10010421_59560 [Streptomyces glaucus]|uniref:Secreted protein n=1 Tax=Streptomyces glaucus TaxID=284029 RepID=A0ABP5XMH5_9ACTN